MGGLPFYLDGKPDGMVTGDLFGWPGHLLVSPRTRISDALKRPKSSYAGVYILLGELDDEPLAYIGEAEDVARRIKSHDAKIDWWTKVVLITSTSKSLNKAHVKYLEARLLQLGKHAANTKFGNGKGSSFPSLSEADKSNMETFVDQLLMILPAVRVDLFINKTKFNKTDTEKSFSSTPENPIFELALIKEGIKATAIIEDGEFVVLKGSLARATYIGEPNSNSTYLKLHAKLIEKGILVLNGKRRVFSESYAFPSTSAAGAVCNGRSTAGPIAWKIKGTGQTYKDWEAKSLDDICVLKTP